MFSEWFFGFLVSERFCGFGLVLWFQSCFVVSEWFRSGFGVVLEWFGVILEWFRIVFGAWFRSLV